MTLLTLKKSTELIEQLRAENEVLKAGIKCVRDMINVSLGVSGLHINNEIMPWDDLQEGGFYEFQLLEFNEAEKLIKEGE